MSTEEMIEEMEAQSMEDDLFDDSTDVPLELDYTTQS